MRFMFQGGDITLNNGDGGESIYGEPFRDESSALDHFGRGGSLGRLASNP